MGNTNRFKNQLSFIVITFLYTTYQAKSKFIFVTFGFAQSLVKLSRYLVILEQCNVWNQQKDKAMITKRLVCDF